MSSYSVWRLFLRLEKPGRLPFYGRVGITSTSSVFERGQSVIRDHDNEKTKRASIGFNNNLQPFVIRPIMRSYSTAATLTDVMKDDAVARELAKKKPKTLETPKILLLSETNALTVVTLDEAHKMALKKRLHLVEVHGESAIHLSKDKKVYKLVKDLEFVEDKEVTLKDPKEKEVKKEKELKTVILRSKAADHDVLSKVKQMVKWIEKGHPIRVMIGQEGDKGNSEHVYHLIESNMKESGARFLQKVKKGDQIRFQVVPPKEGQPVNVPPQAHRGKTTSPSPAHSTSNSNKTVSNQGNVEIK